MKTSTGNRAHLRFSAAEYEEVVKDAKMLGMTVSSLIKTVYFQKKPLQSTFHNDDAKRILVELNRIGNNVNQIARQLNSGFRSGFTPAMDEILVLLAQLRTFASGACGHR